MEWYDYVIIVYLIVMNIVAVAVTVHDKKAAKRKRYRVPEKTLLTLAALSGCVGMYITMKVIRHKTKHSKFMVGIPVIFIAEVLVFIGAYNYLA